MGNDTRHYFGAYLEIKLKQRDVTEYGHTCTSPSRTKAEDGWVRSRFSDVEGYCPFCGNPVAGESRITQEYPTRLVDYTDESVLGEEFEDVLAELKVPELHGKGVILAKGNQSDGTRWLSLSCDRWGGEESYPFFPQFPDANAIHAMKTSLVTVYADAITTLKASPLVESVEVKAGYVLDQDY